MAVIKGAPTATIQFWEIMTRFIAGETTKSDDRSRESVKVDSSDAKQKMNLARDDPCHLPCGTTANCSRSAAHEQLQQTVRQAGGSD